MNPAPAIEILQARADELYREADELYSVIRHLSGGELLTAELCDRPNDAEPGEQLGPPTLPPVLERDLVPLEIRADWTQARRDAAPEAAYRR